MGGGTKIKIRARVNGRKKKHAKRDPKKKIHAEEG